MIENLLKRITKNMNSITISKGVDKYLTRYYVFLKDRIYANIFIHHFHRSDMDMGLGGYGLLHSHPFPGLSFIWCSGYREERRMPDDSISVRIVKPFTFNYISRNTFHRVDLLDESKGCWTIFFTGSRKNKTWFFWDRVSKETIPWQNIVGAVE